MKPCKLITISILVILLALIAASRSVIAQSGGNYNLTWNTIASGGVASGGVYSIDSAIGQTIAGMVAGTGGPGGYTLCAGYLCGVQPPARLFLPLVLK
jgi:hypothetical protein